MGKIEGGKEEDERKRKRVGGNLEKFGGILNDLKELGRNLEEFGEVSFEFSRNFLLLLPPRTRSLTKVKWERATMIMSSSWSFVLPQRDKMDE